MITDSRPPSLSQKAYQEIRRKIVSLELAPGAVIDEALLRDELELGRTPIREALQRLALEKLVTIIPRRGMFVTEIGITDLQRLFEVRLVLEGLAAKLAAQRGTEKHWDRMEGVLMELIEDESPPNNEQLIAIDETCHQIMYDAADNKFLRDTLNTLYNLSLRLWYFALSDIGDMHAAIMEHGSILEALRKGDSEQSARLLGAHIQTFQEEIQSVMLGDLK